MKPKYTKGEILWTIHNMRAVEVKVDGSYHDPDTNTYSVEVSITGTESYFITKENHLFKSKEDLIDSL